MDDKILTRHPDKGKQGVRIDREKYETMRDAILNTLRLRGELTFTELGEAVEKKLAGRFDGSVSWYYTTVKLDLEARKAIRRVPKSSPQRIELAN